MTGHHIRAATGALDHQDRGLGSALMFYRMWRPANP
jgi:hypothetical protein